MDRALVQRDEVKDMPSFSLGFTQDKGDDLWAGVQDIAREFGGHSGAGKHDDADVDGVVLESPRDTVHDQQPPASWTPITPAPNAVPVLSDAPQRCPRKGKAVVRDQHTGVTSPPVVREYLVVLREDQPPMLVNEATTGRWIDEDIIMRPFRCQEIFRYKDCVVVLEDIKSLHNKVAVRPRVIDVWSCILNHLEGLRGENQVCRFFASIVVGRAFIDMEGSRLARFEVFTDRMNEEFDRTIIQSWGSVGLFVFPVLMDDEYYMLCVDVKNEKHTIIDSSSCSPSTEARYGMIPEDLADLLSLFLDDLGLEAQSRVVLATRPSRLRMGWRVRNNTVDSGVFTMRHMESYEGQELDKWDCGLTKADPHQAKLLHLRYIHAITTCGINSWREKNMAYAMDHDKQAGHPTTDVDLFRCACYTFLFCPLCLID